MSVGADHSRDTDTYNEAQKLVEEEGSKDASIAKEHKDPDGCSHGCYTYACSRNAWNPNV